MIKKPTQLVASALGNHVNNQLRCYPYFGNCKEIANSETADNSPDKPATSSGMLERQANTKD